MQALGASRTSGRTALGVRPQLSGTLQEEAALSLVLSSKAFGGVSGWTIQTADWNRSAMILRDRTAIEVANLERNVLGKLGDPDAQDLAEELYGNWVYLNKKAQDALNNPPSWGEQVWAKLQQFMADFKAGALQGWQDLTSTAIGMAEPVLKAFWETSTEVKRLEASIEVRRQDGEDVSKDAGLLDKASAYLAHARSIYSKMSLGASLDQVARERYGTSALGAVSPNAVLLVIGIVAIAGVVWMARDTVREVSGNAKEAAKNFWEFLVENKEIVGAISVLGIALVFLVKD